MFILAKKTKTPRKTQKGNNLLKTQIILNIKISDKGGPVFTFSLPGGRLAPCPLQLRHWLSVLDARGRRPV